MNEHEVLKVNAYLTRERDGKRQLLVFLNEGYEHTGWQVPGGTVEEGEPLEKALMREIEEESGLTDVRVVDTLGDYAYVRESDGQQFRRYYYHLTVGECAETFTWVVNSKDKDNGWVYHYQWLDLDAAQLPTLFAHEGVYLHRIV